MKAKARRGQLTVFFIIGIALLFAIILILSIYQKVKGVQQVELVSPEAMPVKTYVESCLYATGERAVEILGMQGGYIYPLDDIKGFVPLVGTNKVPYWWIDGEERIPSEPDMQKEISTYITTNLRDCLGNYQVFPELKVSSAGQINVKTTITNEEVVIEADYPLMIETGSKRHKLTTFRTELPVRLKHIRNLAVDLLIDEKRIYKIEKTTLDIMAYNTKKIPMNKLTLGCDTQTYSKNQVKKNFVMEVEIQLPLIRINTGNPLSLNPLSMGFAISDMFSWKPDLTTEQPDMTATVHYNKEPEIIFKVTPSNGDEMNLAQVRGIGTTDIVCLVNIFSYEIEYPVILSIHDPKSYNGKGYFFNIAFPVQIQNNQGVPEIT